LRVVLLEHPLAIVHGCLAQAFFALLVGLAVVTSRVWAQAPDAPPLAGVQRLRVPALGAAALIYLQIVFGALLTHTGMRLDAHVIGAVLVMAAVGVVGTRVLAGYAERTELRRPALLALAVLVTQLGLGVGVYLWRFTAVNAAMSPAVGLALQAVHRITGSAVLASLTVLALRIVRLSATPAPAAQTGRSRATLVGDALAAGRGRGVPA
jgi:cytochrome c oxidase assembly protein subunit 15